MKQDNELEVFTSLHEFMKFEPAKISKSDYARAKICEQIEKCFDENLWTVLKWCLQLKRSDELTSWGNLVSSKKADIVELIAPDFEMMVGQHKI